jgi:shikimate kinase
MLCRAMPTPRRKDVPSLSVDRPIVLVGMMGAGKTTVGRRLAGVLGLPFHDADAEIEAAAGMSVSELFEKHGEASFRQGETKVIERLLAGAPIVLATGGGALTTEATRDLVAKRAISVWLRADVDTLVRRATRRPTRPLLKKGDPKETITRLLAERTPYYAAATLTVDSQAGAHGKTVAAILAALDAHLAAKATA